MDKTTIPINEQRRNKGASYSHAVRRLNLRTPIHLQPLTKTTRMRRKQTTKLWISKDLDTTISSFRGPKIGTDTQNLGYPIIRSSTERLCIFEGLEKKREKIFSSMKDEIFVSFILTYLFGFLRFLSENFIVLVTYSLRELE